MLKNYTVFDQELEILGDGKKLINTLNAHSYNLTRKDKDFATALQNCEVLIPDGIAIVFAKKLLEGKKLKKIAGADLFYYNMNRLQNMGGGKVFFLGSSEKTLNKILIRATNEFPAISTYTYSPPYKAIFSSEDNKKMIDAVNKVKPDVLFVGMTAPKQEKWSYNHFDELHVGHICCIGAVFDFYAGTIKRAPNWMIKMGLEWFFRLKKEPKRLWKRYIFGNALFIFYVIQEYFKKQI